jgi:hypothetical protein
MLLMPPFVLPPQERLCGPELGDLATKGSVISSCLLRDGRLGLAFAHVTLMELSNPYIVRLLRIEDGHAA